MSPVPGGGAAARGGWVRRVAVRLLAGGVALGGLVAAVWLLVVLRRALPDEASGGSPMAPAPAGPATGEPPRRLLIPDTLLGRSRAVRFAALSAEEADALPGLREAFASHPASGSFPVGPATLALDVAGTPFTVFLVRPFAHKRGEMMGSYRLGLWPAERWMMAANYLNPDGFVEVHPSTADTRLSDHFVLRDFLTRDQEATWPKFVLLEERLLDKLELVLRELETRGVEAGRAVVLSGFRAPYYNDRAIDEGAARASRHLFGDAADLIIDADGDGRMDDLNRDGRSDLRDVTVIARAVAAVERRHPELLGGLGTYAAMGPSGPFAHIDVRGTSARWEARCRPRADC